MKAKIKIEKPFKDEIIHEAQTFVKKFDIANVVVPLGTLCDVCGSDDIIEAPSMGRNCNTCNPI